MSDMRKYNASFILDMHGSTDTVEAITNKLSNVVMELGGNISDARNLGQKNFERVANKKFANGIYLQVLFDGPASIVNGIKSKLSLDRTINRILIESVR